MTRNANQSFLEQQRFVEKQKTRRELEEKKLEAERQKQALIEADKKLRIVIQAVPVSADRALSAMRDIMLGLGQAVPEAIVQAMQSMRDQSAYQSLMNQARSSGDVYVGIDAAREEKQEPKPPRIESSTFSLIEVDDEN